MIQCKHSHTCLLVMCLSVCMCKGLSRAPFLSSIFFALGVSNFRWYERHICLIEILSAVLSKNGLSRGGISLIEQFNHLDWLITLVEFLIFFQRSFCILFHFPVYYYYYLLKCFYYMPLAIINFKTI